MKKKTKRVARGLGYNEIQGLRELARFTHDAAARFQPVIDALNRQIHEIGKLEPYYRTIQHDISVLTGKVDRLIEQGAQKKPVVRKKK